MAICETKITADPEPKFDFALLEHEGVVGIIKELVKWVCRERDKPISTREAAGIVGVDPDTLRLWTDQGIGPSRFGFRNTAHYKFGEVVSFALARCEKRLEREAR